MKRHWSAVPWGAAVLLATAAWAAPADWMPGPGTINYTEGQVTLDGQNVKSGASQAAVLGANQVLDTAQGKAEVLLNPGIFLRLGDYSEVRMISPDYGDMRVAVTRGEAMVEAAVSPKDAHLAIDMNATITRIDKAGLYDFNANPAIVRVLNGEATVDRGGKHLNLKEGHEVLLSSARLKAQSIDQSAMQADPLYAWSSMRSQDEAQANMAMAQNMVDNSGWYGPGWYWSPAWDCYAFMPGAGLYSPFGWGFYPPLFIGGYWGGFPHVGFHYHPFYGRGFHGAFAAHGGFGGGFHGGFHGGFGGGHGRG